MAQICIHSQKKVAKLEVLNCNSPVGRSRVNLAASHRRIAVETGLKDHIFLQFLRISVTGALPRGSKMFFFVVLEPFHSTTFCSGNVSFQLQNPTPRLHPSEQKLSFCGCFVVAETANPLFFWGLFFFGGYQTHA